MHATEAPVESPQTVPTTHREGRSPARPRSWRRAFADLRDGFSQRELWGHLGWQDIRQRYRRSVLGPLWITISMGIMAVGLGLLYAQLLGMQVSTFLPYITTGFIVWNFLIGCLTEGTDTFTSNEGLIKQLPAPLTVYVLRTIWRQTLLFLHNLVIYFVVIAIFWEALTTDGYQLTDGGIPQPGLDASALLAIPGFMLLAINAGWVVLLFGIVSTRIRDIPQVIHSLTTLLLFMTPIVWTTDVLQARFANGQGVGALSLVYQLNPLYHYIQVVRAPLIGNAISPWSWVVVCGCTVVGWAVALAILRNYRSRVSYWV